VLFNFPSRYYFTIGRTRVFSLRRWFSQIHARSHVSRITRVINQRRYPSFRINDYHALWCAFPNTSASFSFCNFPACAWSIPTTPSKNFEGLGYSHFARRYSGNHIVFFSTGYWDGSLPQVGFTLTMYSSKNDTSYSYRVSPFGNLRVLACLQLIVAFRSLPRPSSPVYA